MSGFVALYATKGARLHRRIGMVFVCAMLTTALFGVTIAAVRGVAPAVNIPAALLTSYLVITALITVRPPCAGSRWPAPGLMLLALGVGLASLTFAVEAFAAGGQRNGMPAFPFVMFARSRVAGKRRGSSGHAVGTPWGRASTGEAPLAFYLLWRVRIRRSLRGIVGVSATEASLSSSSV